MENPDVVFNSIKHPRLVELMFSLVPKDERSGLFFDSLDDLRMHHERFMAIVDDRYKGNQKEFVGDYIQKIKEREHNRKAHNIFSLGYSSPEVKGSRRNLRKGLY